MPHLCDEPLSQSVQPARLHEPRHQFCRHKNRDRLILLLEITLFLTFLGHYEPHFDVASHNSGYRHIQCLALSFNGVLSVTIAGSLIDCAITSALSWSFISKTAPALIFQPLLQPLMLRQNARYLQQTKIVTLQAHHNHYVKQPKFKLTLPEASVT